MLIEIDFNSDEAIYVQLQNQIIMGIAMNLIQEGDSLPSVRQLANTVGINMHARAIITYPKLILADEPTGALDSRSTDSLLDVFETINQNGHTILMVTHSAKAASRAGRILFIKDGRLFHQIYRGESSNEELYRKISDTLTILATGERKNG